MSAFRCSYTSDVANRPQVRGVMLSQGSVSDDDFRTLKDWGATVARCQMYPFGDEWKGKTGDMRGFASWLDWKLDRLMGETLPLARKYGIPLPAIIIGEFVINIIFFGFIALGAPTAIQDVITGLALLLVVTLTTRITKGEIVK